MTQGKLKVLDLFSGIGGFSLGLERTGGFQTVAFCEIEDFPRRVLAKHWPGVPCYDDVRTLTADRLRADGIAGVDVITGGFPCQDLSLAGKQAGLAGERSGLWSEIARLTGELRPKFIVVENVANLLSGPSGRPGGWFGRVLGDLAELGYNAQWEVIPASAIGADHSRARVWVVAYPDEIRRYAAGQHSYVKHVLPRGQVWSSAPPIKDRRDVERRLVSLAPDCHGSSAASRDSGKDDVVPNGLDRIAALGNAVVPKIPELIGHAILESMRLAA